MAEFPFKPRVVVWELTLRCNMRCIHCGSTAGQPRPDELSVEEGFNLIDQLVDLGMEVITLSGGEPLTHPAWDQYAKRLVEAGVHTYIITNGLLLEQNIDRIVASGVKRLGISFDGTEPVHDKIRNHPGCFKKAIAGAHKAMEAGLKMGAVTHVSGANIGELQGMYDILHREGFKFWQIQTVFHQGRMKEHPEFWLDPQELPKVVQFVAECQKKGEIDVIPGDNLGYYSIPSIRKRPWKGCNAGRHLLGVEANGNIKGCLSLPSEFVEGNIRKEPLRQIWEDPERFRLNRYFDKSMLKGHCRNCPHAIPCRAGCWVTAYSASGDRFDNPVCAFRVQSGKGECGWEDEES